MRRDLDDLRPIDIDDGDQTRTGRQHSLLCISRTPLHAVSRILLSGIKLDGKNLGELFDAERTNGDGETPNLGTTRDTQAKIWKM